MSVKKFRFVSPGIFINEVDNSQLPAPERAFGPVIIGRTTRGPGMRPVKVNSFSEFVETFGTPVGGKAGGDVWRDGNRVGPTYAAYAAQAWLRANTGPVTMVRLLGTENADKTNSGRAGWETSAGVSPDQSAGGAYGLWVVNSGSTTNGVTGSLAAVWYLDQGSIELTGTIRGQAAGHGSSTMGGTSVQGTGVLIESIGTSKEFKAIIKNSSGAVVHTTAFNFDPDSDKYVRKRFNTNPQLCNSSIATDQKTYWLGETFERHLDEYVTGSAAGENYGVLLGLESGSYEWKDNRGPFQNARTGYFISQDITTNSGSYSPEAMQKLFYFVGLDHGAWLQDNLKVSIEDIKASSNSSTQYGSFSVVLRRVNDHDGAVQIVERFSSCNLNPNSIDYVARKIGDQYASWSDTENRYIWHGIYQNRSRFLRIVMNQDVDNGTTDATYLPYGIYGPVRPTGFTVLSGSDSLSTYGSDTASTALGNHWVRGSDDIVNSLGATETGSIASDVFVNVGGVGTAAAPRLSFTGSFRWPEIPLRQTASATTEYFGADTTKYGATVSRHEESVSDVVRPLPVSLGETYSFTPDNLATEYSWVFSLDDVIISGSQAHYSSGSRVAGTSATAVSGTYQEIIDNDYNRFTSVFFGGFDGLNIKEAEPFANRVLDASESQVDNYAFHTLRRAIYAVADPEVIECNLMAMPGVTNETMTKHLLDTCEDRADALAVIDLKGDYKPFTENSNSEASRVGNVTTTILNLKQRGINSSYGCSYYPWVQIRDTESSKLLFCPPSVVALGTFGSSQRRSEIWFAPAGFNRGGLTEGSAGIPVVGVRERLTSKQRDDLYEANINPIATFPAEGIVIFGQKTLQVTPSALDRVNVRRLMIYLKKQISRFAAEILFDQNVQTTWDRFTGKVNPFLDSVKSRLGLTEYKVVLDSTTTTPDLIDRNVLYAKIFLKPARAIEFIAIDFVITNTGASFED